MSFVWRMYCADVFSTISRYFKESVDYDGFSTLFANIFVQKCYLRIEHGYSLINLLETLPSLLSLVLMIGRNMYAAMLLVSSHSIFVLIGAELHYKEVYWIHRF